MRNTAICAALLLVCSCTNNGDEQSRPDPVIDTATTKALNSNKDSNAREDAGRMGDSTGTRSPHLSKDSLQH